MATLDKERHLQQLAWYARNCATSPDARILDGLLLSLVYVFEPWEPEDQPRGGPLPGDDGFVESREALAAKRAKLHQYLEVPATLPKADNTLERNVAYAAEEFSLDEIEVAILLLILRSGPNKDLQRFAEKVHKRLEDPHLSIATLIGAERADVERRLRPNSTLIGTGILVREDDSQTLIEPYGTVRLSSPLRKAFREFAEHREAWTASLLGPSLTASLEWDDFVHLGNARELSSRLLAGALRDGEKGINLLLYGPPGTGKTEFASVLASHVGCPMWSSGEHDDEGDEPNRLERLAELRLGLDLLSRRSKALLLMDEAEDVLTQSAFFGSKDRSNFSKVFVHRLLESCSVPVVWTCNDVGDIDPAILRRMSFVMEIGTPGRSVRQRIWDKVLKDEDLRLEEGTAAHLAEKYHVPPALAANAARAARLAKGGKEEIEEVLSGHSILLNLKAHDALPEGPEFMPRLVNCSENLESLADLVAQPKSSKNWSLCLYGPPGTGKSEFARFLAKRLNLEVMQKRASDLLSMWLGGTEKRIAAAFRAARSQDSMLVFDEADSLLQDRRGAVRSWEVSQVNEMLTWMESHPLPFVCTTNLMDRLDEASLRRFTFKLRFDFLTQAQARLAFKHFFGRQSPDALPPNLTPGDFATARRKNEVLNVDDPKVLVRWLEEEASAKGSVPLDIGFKPHASSE